MDFLEKRIVKAKEIRDSKEELIHLDNYDIERLVEKRSIVYIGEGICKRNTSLRMMYATEKAVKKLKILIKDLRKIKETIIICNVDASITTNDINKSMRFIAEHMHKNIHSVFTLSMNKKYRIYAKVIIIAGLK